MSVEEIDIEGIHLCRQVRQLDPFGPGACLDRGCIEGVESVFPIRAALVKYIFCRMLDIVLIKEEVMVLDFVCGINELVVAERRSRLPSPSSLTHHVTISAVAVRILGAWR